MTPMGKTCWLGVVWSVQHCHCRESYTDRQCTVVCFTINASAEDSRRNMQNPYPNEPFLRGVTVTEHHRCRSLTVCACFLDRQGCRKVTHQFTLISRVHQWNKALHCRSYWHVWPVHWGVYCFDALFSLSIMAVRGTRFGIT